MITRHVKEYSVSSTSVHIWRKNSCLLRKFARFACFITYKLIKISMYKLGDVGVSSNLIGSLSLTNGHCPPPRRWIMKQWPAAVNSRFAEVTENDIPRQQDIKFLMIQRKLRN